MRHSKSSSASSLSAGSSLKVIAVPRWANERPPVGGRCLEVRTLSILKSYGTGTISVNVRRPTAAADRRTPATRARRRPHPDLPGGRSGRLRRRARAPRHLVSLAGTGWPPAERGRGGHPAQQAARQRPPARARGARLPPARARSDRRSRAHHSPDAAGQTAAPDRGRRRRRHRARVDPRPRYPALRAPARDAGRADLDRLAACQELLHARRAADRLAARPQARGGDVVEQTAADLGGRAGERERAVHGRGLDLSVLELDAELGL